MADPSECYLIYACGGHARVVADALLTSGHEVVGFVDDDPVQQGSRVLGLPVFAPAELAALASRRRLFVALGIGNNERRAASFERIAGLGLTVKSVLHPASTVSRSATVGEGTVVFAGAVINAEAVVGRGCIVNTGAIVEHGAIVGDFVHLSPRATLAGCAKIGAGSQLGAHGVVLPNVSVGSRTVVGSGAVVTRDLPDDVVAYGVPAKVRRRRGQEGE